MSTDTSKPRRGDAARHRGAKPDEQPADRGSGRVAFDDRGNAIWEWSVATGRFTTSVSTARLKKLEHPGLSLLDEAAPAETAAPRPAAVAAPAVAPAATSAPRRPGMGYSPYDSGMPAPKPAGKTSAAPAPKKNLRRLGEFFALRKQAERNKSGKD